MNRFKTLFLLFLLAVLMVLMGNAIGGRSGMVMAIIAPIAAMLIPVAVSRAREYMDDESGVMSCGKPLALARALGKLLQASRMVPRRQAQAASGHLVIVDPLPGCSLVNRSSTHPPLEEWIARQQRMAASGGQ